VGETGGYRVRVTATVPDSDDTFITRTDTLPPIRLMGGDPYIINVTAGQRIIADLTSSEFDPVLRLTAPSGKQTENDDYEGASDRSRIELMAGESGRWEVKVESATATGAGSYTLQLNRPIASIKGSLDDGDDQLSSGEYADVYTVDLTAGQEIRVSVLSLGIDPFLILVDPNGETTENYAHRGIDSSALIKLTADVTGAWTIIVTSVEPGETGVYALITTPSTREGGRVGRALNERSERGEGARLQGTLSSSDRTLNKGEYFDPYYVTVNEGDRIQATLTSDAFDTYLVAMSSSGDRQENDDDEGLENRSELDFRATEEGQWRIWATSYSGGERGAYTLELKPAPIERPVAAQAFRGELTASDRTLDSGEYYDTYYFQADARQTVTVELTSLDFDTHIVVADPQGDNADNNDFRHSKRRSSREPTPRAGGAWLVTVHAHRPTGAGA